MEEKHKFSFFCSSIIVKDHHLIITDEKLAVRLVNIVRLRTKDECIFFDAQQSYLVKLESLNNRCIEAEVITSKLHTSLKPELIVLAPLLKKAAFEEVMYACVEMGATEIYPLITQKVQQRWDTKKDNERLTNIMIAAAEQSKQFVFPILHDLQQLTANLISSIKKNSPGIFFDVDGKPAFEVFSELKKTNPERILLLWGPEGDLSKEEKEMVAAAGMNFCALTPTILRAQQAAMLGLGMARSLLA